MAKPPIELEVDIDKLVKSLNTFARTAAESVSKRDRKKIGRKAIALMKKEIAKGRQTIKGRKRYERYKKPKKYPGKRKPARPVNLKLSGDMLKALDQKTTRRSVKIFYNDPVQREKEQGHRDGGTKKHPNSQAVRPTIPINSEVLSRVITNELEDLYADIISEKIEKLAK